MYPVYFLAIFQLDTLRNPSKPYYSLRQDGHSSSASPFFFTRNTAAMPENCVHRCSPPSLPCVPAIGRGFRSSGIPRSGRPNSRSSSGFCVPDRRRRSSRFIRRFPTTPILPRFFLTTRCFRTHPVRLSPGADTDRKPLRHRLSGIPLPVLFSPGLPGTR